MKYLFLETVFDSPHLETSAEIALNIDKKNDVFFSWIGDDLPWSDWYLSKTKRFFGASIKKKVFLIEEILKKKSIKIIKPSIIEEKHSDKIKNWAKNFKGNLSNLKNFTYNKQNLGLGVSSSLISFFHQSNFDTKKNKKTVIKSLMSSAIIYERSLDLIERIKPDYIVTFNNRFATSLPIILAAKKNKIKIIRHERGSNFNKYEIFKKDVHNLSYRADNVNYYWNIEKNLKKKLDIAKKYFLNRRKGIPLSWDLKKNHAINQLSGYVPVKKKKYRIVFYTTNEDEHESIKDQLTNVVWQSQEVALKKLIRCLSLLKNFELYIRVHPVSDKRKSLNDQNKWQKFENGKNIFVVPYDGKINSYELLDTANLVVTYGGNIGIEAVYWGKNVITLRNAIYSKGKLIFEPKNFNELKKYIINLEFLRKPLNKKKIIPYAYYFMVFGKKFKFFKYSNFEECFYKNEPISHLSPFMRKVKKIYKKTSI